MDALDAIVQAQLGTTEDGSTAIAWAGRCPRPWLEHEDYPDSQVASSGTCNYRAGQGAFSDDEIAQADQLPMLELYPATTGGFAQASARHKNLPWHRLQWLSVDTDDCRGLCAVVAARRRKWQKDHPQAERSEP
jgi:hypothetical protein